MRAAAYADRRAVRGLARGGRAARRVARQGKAPPSTSTGVPHIATCERQVAKHASANGPQPWDAGVVEQLRRAQSQLLLMLRCWPFVGLAAHTPKEAAMLSLSASASEQSERRLALTRAFCRPDHGCIDNICLRAFPLLPQTKSKSRLQP
jgi:hypothetical protein